MMKKKAGLAGKSDMWKSFSIREMFLTLMIVAIFLAWLSAAPAWYKLRDLQTATGHIRQDNGNVIYVRQRDSERSKQWRFKILVPEGANYTYRWEYELGESVPLFLPCPNQCFERQVDLIVFLEHQSYSVIGKTWTTFHYHGNSSTDHELTVDSAVANYLNGVGNNRRANRSQFSDGFAATYAYDSGLHEFPLGEKITLLRLKGKHPETDKDIWIELNMVPISDAEAAANRKAVAIPNGAATTMGNASPDKSADSED